MSLEGIVTEEKHMTDREFLLELSKRICNGTAKEDPALSNFNGTPEQASAFYVRALVYGEDVCRPKQLDLNARYI